MRTSLFGRSIHRFDHFISSKRFFQVASNAVASGCLYRASDGLVTLHHLESASERLYEFANQKDFYEVVYNKVEGIRMIRLLAQTKAINCDELSFVADFRSPYWVFSLHYEC